MRRVPMPLPRPYGDGRRAASSNSLIGSGCLAAASNNAPLTTFIMPTATMVDGFIATGQHPPLETAILRDDARIIDEPCCAGSENWQAVDVNLRLAELGDLIANAILLERLGDPVGRGVVAVHDIDAVGMQDFANLLYDCVRIEFGLALVD